MYLYFISFTELNSSTTHKLTLASSTAILLQYISTTSDNNEKNFS